MINFSINDSSVDTRLEIGPKDRIKRIKVNNQILTEQFIDLAYFSTKMQFKYDRAIVRITFKNTSPEQTVFLGYKNQSSWHYDSKLISAPMLDMLNWPSVGTGPVLMQREKKYNSLKEFLIRPPKEGLVGTYELSSGIQDFATDLKDYKPAASQTTIKTPLRGKHIMYVYLKDEPFFMEMIKQDLNMYNGPDPVIVTIYKGKDQVFQANASDDGVTDNSRKFAPPQKITIRNPGPETPESGVYKVVIDAGTDSVVQSITTNLHKIVFEGPIFPIANAQVYPRIISKTTPTMLFTNALMTTFQTYHSNALQTMKFGNTQLSLDTIKEEVSTVSSQGLQKIILPKSDVIVNGFMGYFAFSPDQYFTPTKFYIVPIVNPDQLDAVDYVLTDYVPAKRDGEWSTASVIFDLKDAYIENGKLSWLIKASGLKENKRSIFIKDIDVTLEKRPLPILVNFLHLHE